MQRPTITHPSYVHDRPATSMDARYYPSTLRYHRPQFIGRSTGLPPRQNDGRSIKRQERWEEMNRREKMDLKFENATPETEQQIEELNAKKSKEHHRRLQWDLDWKSQSRASVSADNTDADSTARSTCMTSEEQTNPQVKARERSGVVGQKKGRRSNEMNHKGKKGKGKK